MKVPIRATLLGVLLAMTLAAPVLAAPPSTIHESFSSCRTDEVTAFTYCFESETDTTTKDKQGGSSEIRKTGWIHSTVTDVGGNLVSSYDMTIDERDVTQVAGDGSVEYTRIDIRMSEEITEGSATSCIRTRVLVIGADDKVNEVTIAEGPC